MFLEILIIADKVVGKLHFPAAQIFLLEEGEGLADVRRRLRAGDLDQFLEARLVVLMTGRAELEVDHPAFACTAWATLVDVCCFWRHAKVLVSSPLPKGDVGEDLLGRLHQAVVS